MHLLGPDKYNIGLISNSIDLLETSQMSSAKDRIYCKESPSQTSRVELEN